MHYSYLFIFLRSPVILPHSLNQIDPAITISFHVRPHCPNTESRSDPGSKDESITADKTICITDTLFEHYTNASNPLFPTNPCKQVQPTSG